MRLRISLHHFVAKASWQDAALLAAVRTFVVPEMRATATTRPFRDALTEMELPYICRCAKLDRSVGAGNFTIAGPTMEDGALARGTKGDLVSRFGTVRVRPSHRDYWRAEPRPEEWLLQQVGNLGYQQHRLLLADGHP